MVDFLSRVTGQLKHNVYKYVLVPAKSHSNHKMSPSQNPSEVHGLSLQSQNPCYGSIQDLYNQKIPKDEANVGQVQDDDWEEDEDINYFEVSVYFFVYLIIICFLSNKD